MVYNYSREQDNGIAHFGQTNNIPLIDAQNRHKCHCWGINNHIPLTDIFRYSLSTVCTNIFEKLLICLLVGYVNVEYFDYTF